MVYDVLDLEKKDFFEYIQICNLYEDINVYVNNKIIIFLIRFIYYYSTIEDVRKIICIENILLNI